ILVLLTVCVIFGSIVPLFTITQIVMDAPSASFSASTYLGYAPLQVTFADTSSNSPTSWSWDFGDGGSSSGDPTPTYTFNNPGTWTVSLTVSNDNGSATATRQITVNALPPAP